ncbi:phosphoribosylamine--glycine ligase [Thermithiobacillus plumbiphilus]|uniref:Phosphoribosylamine--glycine ligase n=1 Tax=Thermithiobacillus plumbiphilus TaxID=1729899 RepID=A0ABU9D668_9PROT
MSQKILVIGNGGREHALAWKLAQSPRVGQVYCAPGNAGTALEAGVENLPISASDIDALLRFAREKNIDLTVVGPEAPLVAGLVDAFQAAGLRIFGPTAQAAQLEGSKAFAKDFLARHAIPTAAYRHFEDLAAAEDYIRSQRLPLVIKADGLAAGKGVIIAETLEQALDAARDWMQGGGRIVVEEFLQGEEASFIVVAAQGQVQALATSQDHKRLLDADWGPNTGGMGAYSPAPVVDAATHQRIMESVILSTLRGLESEGIPYTGFLYAGLMIENGQPKVLEFNCRMGDPETQPILMRLQSDLLDLLDAAVDGHLQETRLEWDSRPALCVVMAAAGYPDNPRKGDAIQGLDTAALADSKVFHAGTELKNGQVLTSGGRVLGVTALGQSVREAQNRAYEAVRQIHWDGEQHRSDIGYRAIAREA